MRDERNKASPMKPDDFLIGREGRIQPEQLSASPFFSLVDLLLNPAGEGEVEVLLIGAESPLAAGAAKTVRPEHGTSEKSDRNK